MFVYHLLKPVVNAQGIVLINMNPMCSRIYTNLPLTIHDFITSQFCIEITVPRNRALLTLGTVTEQAGRPIYQ